jgi:uncharacterized protein YycO
MGRIIVALVLSILLLNNCTNKKGTKFKEGDILMASIECGPLCDAINKVTDGYNGKDYNHCALVISVNDTLKVIEAIGNHVQINSVEKFYARVGDTNAIRNVLHTRLKAPFTPLIDKACSQATTYLNQPYDDAFILNNNKMYCSELVYEAFKFANNGNDVFSCKPMTYKDPATKLFFPPWVQYYKDINHAIPEGELGINPGLISLSEKLEVVE